MTKIIVDQINDNDDFNHDMNRSFSNRNHLTLDQSSFSLDLPNDSIRSRIDGEKNLLSIFIPIIRMLSNKTMVENSIVDSWISWEEHKHVLLIDGQRFGSIRSEHNPNSNEQFVCTQTRNSIVDHPPMRWAEQLILIQVKSISMHWTDDQVKKFDQISHFGWSTHSKKRTKESGRNRWILFNEDTLSRLINRIEYWTEVITGEFRIFRVESMFLTHSIGKNSPVIFCLTLLRSQSDTPDLLFIWVRFLLLMI